MLVHPLMKKTGLRTAYKSLRTAYKNLRPVSYLHVLSKVVERAAFLQV